MKIQLEWNKTRFKKSTNVIRNFIKDVVQCNTKCAIKEMQFILNEIDTDYLYKTGVHWIVNNFNFRDNRRRKYFLILTFVSYVILACVYVCQFYLQFTKSSTHACVTSFTDAPKVDVELFKCLSFSHFFHLCSSLDDLGTNSIDNVRLVIFCLFCLLRGCYFFFVSFKALPSIFKFYRCHITRPL